MADKVRHICGISGGKDSSALAVYMRNLVPEMEYFFCDTGAELPETYEFLDRLEVSLGKKIEGSIQTKVLIIISSFIEVRCHHRRCGGAPQK